MDPNACLARILDALDDPQNGDDFRAAMTDMYVWLQAGGLPPTIETLGTHRVAVGYPGQTRTSPPSYRVEPRTVIISRPTNHRQELTFHLHLRGFDAFTPDYRGGRLIFRREW